MTCDFFKISGDNEGILDSRDLSHSSIKERQLSSLRQFQSLYKMHVEKSEELKYVLQVYAQETTCGDKKYDYCRWKLMLPKTSRAENQGFSFQCERSRRGHICNRSFEQRKSERKRQRQCQKQLREGRLHPLAHSSMNQTRKDKGRGDFLHLLRQVHRIETRKVTDKVAMT